MPIKGFSEPKRIPRVGKIYLGEKQKNAEGKEYPVAKDYFVVRPDGKITSETTANAFHAVYGDTPREITVVFPSDDPENFMPQYLASYRGSPQRPELWCKGNGETASRADGKGGYIEIPCLYMDCPVFQEKKCKPQTRLLFMLPEVEGIGVWELDTSSYHGSQNLIGSVNLIRKCTRGKIAMIPLTLKVVPQTVNPEGKTKTVWVVDLKLENIKMMELLNRIPQLGSEEPMQLIDPINMNEMPDDLYVERNLVTDADIDAFSGQESTPQPQPSQNQTPRPQKQPEPQNASNPLRVISQDDLTDLTNVGAITNIEIRPKNGKDFCKVSLALVDGGDIIDTLATNPHLVNSIRDLPVGTLLQFHTVKAEKVSMPILQDLAIVS